MLAQLQFTCLAVREHAIKPNMTTARKTRAAFLATRPTGAYSRTLAQAAVTAWLFCQPPTRMSCHRGPFVHFCVAISD